MLENINNSMVLVSNELKERGINTVPRVSRATRYETFNGMGETTEVWYTVDFESITCELDSFTRNANPNKYQIDEYITGEFETCCETVRYVARIYHYWTPEEIEILRGIGKLIKVSEPATEYDALVC